MAETTQKSGMVATISISVEGPDMPLNKILRNIFEGI